MAKTLNDRIFLFIFSLHIAASPGYHIYPQGDIYTELGTELGAS